MNYIAQGATVFITLLCVVTPFHASAARLSYGDPTLVQRPELSSTVALPVLLTLDNKECINAADISLVIPQSAFTYLKHNNSESPFSLWLYSDYDSDTGSVHLVAGNPQPICGGQRGTTFTIANLEVAIKNPGTLSFDEDSEVTLSDGYGTNAPLEFMPRSFASVPR